MNEIELLEGLLQRYSPTHHEAEAVNYLVAQMSAAGFAARVDEVGNAVGVIGDGPREVLLLGHIDTVPGFIEVRREDDRLYGRGAVDAKGPLACFTAASALAGARAGYRFVVIGAVGEEGDSRGAQWVRDHYRARLFDHRRAERLGARDVGLQGQRVVRVRSETHLSPHLGQRRECVPGRGEFLESRHGLRRAVQRSSG